MTYETEIKINNRHVTPGTILSFRGKRGRYRFVARVTTDKGSQWLNVYGGDSDPRGRIQWHSFSEGDVRVVHRDPPPRP